MMLTTVLLSTAEMASSRAAGGACGPPAIWGPPGGEQAGSRSLELVCLSWPPLLVLAPSHGHGT